MQRRERAAPAHAFSVQAWCPQCALGRRKQDTKNGGRGPDALHFFTATRTKLGSQIKVRDRESTRYSDTQTTAASAHVMPHTTANVVLLQVHGEVVLVAFCDASFAGDVEHKSQRGRPHYLIHELEGQHPRYARHLMQLIHDERVCRATLQCEAYSVQHAMEHEEHLRASVLEIRGCQSEGSGKK